ncbi:hypothetical protein BUQ74_05295 [Leptospira weilii serovar Heyan]|uniref:Uncharacterized protein n=1 Tax=Leptospira weilii str. UI 13098 TaxID=1088542 RepID=M6Q8W2_9LEPT|nr:hypothetical protein LEP1GSC108_2597 [Leptospira weilii str. UI 13098]OMI18311.1 hypothetical protein BUQ74_05295 [Leptospira weilii serovar Heyan]
MLRKDKSEQFDSTQVLSDCIPIQSWPHLQDCFFVAPQNTVFLHSPSFWNRNLAFHQRSLFFSSLIQESN